MRLDQRNERLSLAYAENAEECALFGHDYASDLALGGEYACGYCRAARALTAPQPNDKIREAV